MKKARSSVLSLITLFTILICGGSAVALSYGTSAESSPVILTVHVLPTSDGLSGSGLFAEKYPKIVEVKNAAAFADRIAAYGAAYRVWIAPKGWTGSAAIGADGSTLVSLYPASGSAKSGPRFRYLDEGGCAGCALHDAAPYFPSAMQAWKNFFGYETPEVLPRGTKLVRLSPTLVMYVLPGGDRLLGHGAAYFIPPNEDFFAQAEFFLPHADQKLLTFLVKTVVIEQGWK